MARAEKRQRKKDNARIAREAREAALRRKRQIRSIRNGLITAVIVAAGFAIILLITNHNSKKSAAKTTTTTASATTTTTKVAVPAGCDISKKPPASTKSITRTFASAPPMTIDPTKTYTATMSTTCGDIVITLDAKDAPKTVNSFVFLAQHHFYDGLTFHRIAKDFVVQGGDPKGNGTGGPGYSLPTEPPKNGYSAGSVAMANSGPNTTGSQFFLTWTDAGAKDLGGPPYLYSILGNVKSGLDNVKKLGSLYNRDQNPSDPSTQTSAYPLYIFSVSITES